MLFEILYHIFMCFDEVTTLSIEEEQHKEDEGVCMYFHDTALMTLKLLLLPVISENYSLITGNSHNDK